MKKHVAWMAAGFALAFLAGCANTAQDRAKKKAEAAEDSASTKAGTVEVDITDVLGHDLASRVVLRDKKTGARVKTIEAPKGRAKEPAPVGVYQADICVYDHGFPIVVEIFKDFAVKENDSTFALYTLLEGASGNRMLREFDTDHDTVLDRVENAFGSDFRNPCSVPGREPLMIDDTVMDKTPRWYVGEMHAHSEFGEGKETVAQLVRRAERAGLDFMAITDRNTMQACKDPGYKSDSVVLIPAMEWGDDKRGVALLYAPRTLPEPVESTEEGQAMAELVQLQGGAVAIAHPCFPTAPWQWGLSFVNGVEVWCRGWREVPPMWLELLNKDLHKRNDKDKLVYSIAAAASATEGRSANSQAALFWDYELVRGLQACAIAGSNSSSSHVPLASPVTYIFSRDKSLPGLLEGIRFGRTFVSQGLKGPKIHIEADFTNDGKADAAEGGVVPAGLLCRFVVYVSGAKGKKLQVINNGRPVITKIIEGDNFVTRFEQKPEGYSAYRAQVVEPAESEAFGMLDVLAMTSPMYSQIIPGASPAPKAEDLFPKDQGQQGQQMQQLPPGAPPPPVDQQSPDAQPKWVF
jgi:hypothetical protein